MILFDYTTKIVDGHAIVFPSYNGISSPENFRHDGDRWMIGSRRLTDVICWYYIREMWVHRCGRDYLLTFSAPTERDALDTLFYHQFGEDIDFMRGEAWYYDDNVYEVVAYAGNGGKWVRVVPMKDVILNGPNHYRHLVNLDRVWNRYSRKPYNPAKIGNNPETIAFIRGYMETQSIKHKHKAQ